MKKILVTGSSGLVGSAVVRHFHDLGWLVVGVDNNMRAAFFGNSASVRHTQYKLQELPNFEHVEADIRSPAMQNLIIGVRPDAIVHAAAQPSHDKSREIPWGDFDINTIATVAILDVARQYVPESPFIFMSTNKVYGDIPNRLKLVESELRYDLLGFGIDEEYPVDQCTHSPFGASKLAADLMVQEYGRYYGMLTACLRAGCLTGEDHAGVELHGFLSHLVKCNVLDKKYTIYGYNGKQVRDNLHAKDVARFVELFIEQPRTGEVYNIGGGKANSCSILEAFRITSLFTLKDQQYEYLDVPRVGDHICYYSDLSKIKCHYPKWNVSVPLNHIIHDMVEATYEESQHRV